MDHLLTDGLGDEERALEIRVEDGVPLLPGELHGWMPDVQTCVVHEDVDLAVFVDGGAHHVLDVTLVQDVELDGQGLAAEVFDFFFEFRQARLVAAGDDQVRTGPGQRPAEILAEAPAGSRDNRDFT